MVFKEFNCPNPLYLSAHTAINPVNMITEEKIDMYDFHISNNQNHIGTMYLLEDWGGIHVC